MNLNVAILVPLLPLIGAALCAVCCWKHAWAKASYPICAASIGLSFVVTLLLTLGGADGAVQLYEWIGIAHGTPADDAAGAAASGGISIAVRYFFDPLTLLMLFVVTGVGSMIAVYAGGYMQGDEGFPRFFAGVALFIFAMTTLVMADNLVLLFLGWEGVGLCSYLLIGHYFQKDYAVAAAKKAFIVNRVGDFCLLIGLFLLFDKYGTLSLHGTETTKGILQAATDSLKATGGTGSGDAIDTWIPMLLMAGAFGKSAQFPLYVWLPDAMAGPTPVSALVHAATMVTSGVYLIVRMLPVFQLSPCALVTVAAIGGFTALLAATIALCSNDLKGVFAYSTVSQLGYMFVGVGAVSSYGAVQHLYTHAFFKALLFLTAGSVMHAMAGQLDTRKMSGLLTRMPVTGGLMFVGCLALAGLPVITAGFWSKDMILADAMAAGLNDWRGYGWLYLIIAWAGIATALLTAFYTFRLWFTVFTGEERFEMGDEHHHEEHEADDAHAEGRSHGGLPHDAPHEMPWWPMNLPLAVLAIGSTVAGVALFWGMGDGFKNDHYEAIALVEPHDAHAHGNGHADHAEPHGKAGPADEANGAGGGDGYHGEPGHHLHHATFLGGDVHTTMMYVSGLLAIVGIALAAYFHWLNRGARDAAAKAFAPVVRVLQNKYYVDEFYDAVIVQPLRLAGQVFYLVDALLIDGIVKLIGWAPRLLGTGIRPAQSGRLQGYGLGMALGVALLALLGLIVWGRM